MKWKCTRIEPAIIEMKWKGSRNRIKNETMKLNEKGRD